MYTKLSIIAVLFITQLLGISATEFIIGTEKISSSELNIYMSKLRYLAHKYYTDNECNKLRAVVNERFGVVGETTTTLKELGMKVSSTGNEDLAGYISNCVRTLELGLPVQITPRPTPTRIQVQRRIIPVTDLSKLRNLFHKLPMHNQCKRYWLAVNEMVQPRQELEEPEPSLFENLAQKVEVVSAKSPFGFKVLVGYLRECATLLKESGAAPRSVGHLIEVVSETAPQVGVTFHRNEEVRRSPADSAIEAATEYYNSMTRPDKN